MATVGYGCHLSSSSSCSIVTDDSPILYVWVRVLSHTQTSVCSQMGVRWKWWNSLWCSFNYSKCENITNPPNGPWITMLYGAVLFCEYLLMASFLLLLPHLVVYFFLLLLLLSLLHVLTDLTHAVTTTVSTFSAWLYGPGWNLLLPQLFWYSCMGLTTTPQYYCLCLK